MVGLHCSAPALEAPSPPPRLGRVKEWHCSGGPVPASARTQAVAGDKAAMNKILSRTPLGRVGEPSEVASVVKL